MMLSLVYPDERDIKTGWGDVEDQEYITKGGSFFIDQD